MKYDASVEITNKFNLKKDTRDFISKIINDIQKEIKIIPGSIKAENVIDPFILKMNCEEKEEIELKFSTFEKGTIKVELIIKGKNKLLKMYIDSRDKHPIKINGYNLKTDGIYYISTTETHNEDSAIISFYDTNAVKYLLKKCISVKEENNFSKMGIIPDSEEALSVSNEEKVKCAVDFFNDVKTLKETKAKTLYYQQNTN